MHDQPCDHDHPAPATGGLGIQRAGELDAAAFEIAVADLLRACGRLHGFGGIARLVDAIGHRFTYQEWMTRDVADALLTHGQARGAACVVGAEPLCLLLGEGRRGGERVVPGLCRLLQRRRPVAQRVHADDRGPIGLKAQARSRTGKAVLGAPPWRRLPSPWRRTGVACAALPTRAAQGLTRRARTLGELARSHNSESCCP